MPGPRATVLDFDGTLVASMGIHAAAYRRVLGPFGAHPTDHDIYLLEGARSETIIRETLRGLGHKPSDDEVRALSQAKQRAFAELGPPKLYPGADALVQGLAKTGARLGLVTGTRRENLERLIPHLLPLFDVVLSQESYTHDKPHPEPYEKAAQKLDVPAARCIALENAARGVASARAAEYGFVLGVTSTLDADTLLAAGAHETVPDLGAALHRTIHWLGPSRPPAPPRTRNP